MSRVIACLLMALLVGGGVARAEVVQDLYAATVPVRDQGSDALGSAAGLALAQVLVKVSGAEDVLREPGIAAVLRNARQDVQQYAYLPPTGDDERMRVRMEFAGTRVTDIVLGAGLPLWTANRPPVLVWLVLEDDAGMHFATADHAPGLVTALRESFAERGLPLRLPLYDLTDAAALGPQDVWRLDAGQLAAASERYDVRHIVGARLARLAGGEYAGDWTHIEGDKRSDLRIRADSERDYLRQGVAALAGRLAARYAVVASDGAAGGVLVHVSGVEEYADFVAIVRWLEDLEVVQRAAVTKISGNRLELALRAQVDATELATLISLNKRLAPGAVPQPGAALEYEWLR